MFIRTLKRVKTAKMLFVAGIVVFLYVCGYSLMDDVYQVAVLGAMYELLWLPVLLSLAGIPLFGVLILIYNKERKPKIYAALAIALIIGSYILITNH